MNTGTRILIIEDSSDDQELLIRQLRKSQLHHQVKVISDGKKALEFLTGKDSPNEDLVVVFLDLKLPQMSGMQLLEKVRRSENKRIRNIPVIVMTSSNAPEDLRRCEELRVSSYVQKPITFTAFAKAVAKSFHTVPETAPLPAVAG